MGRSKFSYHLTIVIQYSFSLPPSLSRHRMYSSAYVWNTERERKIACGCGNCVRACIVNCVLLFCVILFIRLLLCVAVARVLCRLLLLLLLLLLIDAPVVRTCASLCVCVLVCVFLLLSAVDTLPSSNFISTNTRAAATAAAGYCYHLMCECKRVYVCIFCVQWKKATATAAAITSEADRPSTDFGCLF